MNNTKSIKVGRGYKHPGAKNGAYYAAWVKDAIQACGGEASIKQITGYLMFKGMESNRFRNSATIEQACAQVRQMMKGHIEVGMGFEQIATGVGRYRLTAK